LIRSRKFVELLGHLDVCAENPRHVLNQTPGFGLPLLPVDANRFIELRPDICFELDRLSFGPRAGEGIFRTMLTGAV
jgi:hypothetical protein